MTDSPRVPFNQLLADWNERIRQHPEWRVGQALYQTVYNLDYRLAERLRVSGSDPYYVDALVGPAIGWLVEHWEEK